MGRSSRGLTVTRSAGVWGLRGDCSLGPGGPGGGMSARVGGTEMERDTSELTLVEDTAVE